MTFGGLAESSAFSRGSRRGKKLAMPTFGRGNQLMMVQLTSLAPQTESTFMKARPGSSAADQLQPEGWSARVVDGDKLENCRPERKQASAGHGHGDAFRATSLSNGLRYGLSNKVL